MPLGITDHVLYCVILCYQHTVVAHRYSAMQCRLIAMHSIAHLHHATCLVALGHITQTLSERHRLPVIFNMEYNVVAQVTLSKRHVHGP